MTSIALDSAPAAVRKYYKSQDTVRSGSLDGVFAPDVKFDGIMFKENGDEVQPFVEGFMEKYIENYVLISITELEPSRSYLVLHSVVISGNSEHLPVCDVVTVHDGLISKVQNTFDIQAAKRMLE